MLITKKIEIDMGHRVTNHKSKCRNIHGHRYVIEVGVDDKVVAVQGASDEGMVIDFGDLKQIMNEEIDAKYDHGFMVYDKDPLFQIFKDNDLFKDMKICIVSFIPTAENISRFWYNLLKSRLQEKAIRLKYVKIWETPTSTAQYTEEDEESDLEDEIKDMRIYT